MNILIEGWRGINHSYSLVNQWQILELSKFFNIYFKDIPFISKDWNLKKNSSGLNENFNKIIQDIPNSNNDIKSDIIYRISSPLNFDNDFNSKLLFVFGTCEYKYLDKENYINGSPELLKYDENFFIHTPSKWSKEGFINIGFKDDQIIVIPHGVDKNTFDIISNEEKKIIREKYKINDEDFVLTNIGAMTKNKGVEVLIAAYGILKKKIKNLKLILKDQSNLYDIKTDYLFKKVRESELNTKYGIINDNMMKDIILISENLTLAQLRKIYSITDCYVSPYLAEGFNLTPLEAAACGAQIIVTKGGSTDDYFNSCMGYQIDSKERKINNSYLLEPKIDSLIHILQEKVVNKNDTMKNKRSEFVHNNFSWEKVGNQLKTEFEKKINK